MILSKEMLKEFVEGASAQKVKDFAMKIIDQLNQNQLNAIEQGFKVSLHWQGGDTADTLKVPKTAPIEPLTQTAPRRGRPPKQTQPIETDEDDAELPEPENDEEEGDDVDDIFKNIDKTLSGAKLRKPVDETEREFERVMRTARRTQ